MSWLPRRQECVTLSSAEAEYVTTTDTVKEVLFSKQI